MFVRFYCVTHMPITVKWRLFLLFDLAFRWFFFAFLNICLHSIVCALFHFISFSLYLFVWPISLWNFIGIFQFYHNRQCIAVTKVTSEMFMVNAHCDSLAIDFDSILNGTKWFIKPSAVISSWILVNKLIKSQENRIRVSRLVFSWKGSGAARKTFCRWGLAGDRFGCQVIRSDLHTAIEPIFVIYSRSASDKKPGRWGSKVVLVRTLLSTEQ